MALNPEIREKLPLTQIASIHEDLLNRSTMKGTILLRNEIVKQGFEYYIVITTPYLLIFESEL
ncbi:oxysterol binding protein, partial [Entamoeba histolytica HM-3:IMSS]